MAGIDWSNVDGLLGNDQGTGFADKLSQGVANMFAGPNNPLVSNDPTVMRSNANNALLNLSIGLLKASAPGGSAHGNFGAALGEGLQTAQQGYQQRIDQNLTNAANAFKLRQMQMQNNLVSTLMNGDSQQGSDSTPSTPQFVAGSGSNTVPVGANTAAALGKMGILPVTQTAAPADATGAQSMGSQTSQSSGGAGSEYVIPGMTRTQSALYMINSPGEYWKSLASSHSLSDVQKQAADVYGYGTPEYKDAVTAAVQHQTITPLRAGAAYIGTDGQTHYTLPAAPLGSRYDDNGNLVPIQGAADAIALAASAKARGSAGYRTVNVPMSDGTTVPMTEEQYADYLRQNPQRPAPGGQPAPARGAGVIDNSVGGNAPQVQPVQQAQPGKIASPYTFTEPRPVAAPTIGTQAPGAAAAQTAAGDLAGKQFAADAATAGTYGDRKLTLNNMLSAVNQIETGPQADRTQTIQSTINEFAPWIGKQLGIDPAKITNFDEFKKYSMQVAQNQMSSMGSPSDARLNTAIAGNPNASLTTMANRQITQMLNANNDRNNFVFTQFQDSGLSPDKWPAYKAQMQRQMNPAVFAIDYMTPQQKAAYKSRLTPAQQAQFAREYTYYKQNQ
ncbi:hypothetical protein [Paraburkholderia caribensis]|uniref:hypothetical protein n=1 Tax=Paraburkholderia caribensis TaxID=75105 RepID=UPI00078C6DE1|nr:hypothetical protein [Paraburkholderia caribensis]AMV42256.1 hypothetical protein ATN79_06135 [Paraburkholderia caribensis]